MGKLMLYGGLEPVLCWDTRRAFNRHAGALLSGRRDRRRALLLLFTRHGGPCRCSARAVCLVPIGRGGRDEGDVL